LHTYFYDGRDLQLALDANFDPGIVLLSVALAWLTAYASFNVAERIHASEEGLARRLWLIVGALTMGTGLWAMHFVGMLALRLPVMIRYDLVPTLLSTIPVVATSALLMYCASWPKVGDWTLFACGTLMAAGIGAMHYVSMFAMRGVDHDLVMLVDPKLFVLSVIVAVVFFNGALRLNVLVWRRNPNTRAYWRKAGAALIMGLAVAGTHYVATHASYFFLGGVPQTFASPLSLDSGLMTLWVSLASFLIASLAMLLVVVDHRLQSASAAEQRSRAQMYDAIESMSDGFSVFDKEDRLVLYNNRYLDFLQLGDLKILPGLPFERIMRNAAERGLILEAQGRIDDWMMERLAKHRAPRESFVEHWKGDRWFQISEHTVPAGGTVAIRTEITDLKRTEIDLSRAIVEAKQARATAEEATRLKSAFLANMSHELRTPMNAIIGYSEMLIEEVEEAGDKSYLLDLQKIRTAGKHLLALINDVLDFSKIEAGKMDLYLEKFEISSMLQDVVSTIEPSVAKNGNRLEFRSAESLGSIQADLTKVRQALLNLLSNACKFTSNGVITLTATRENVYGDDWLRFGVSDTGIGISSEQMTKLFKAFSQADALTSKTYGGSGLGLILSRRICQMMGGDITVHSEPGAGSTFTLHLPADGVASKAKAMLETEEAADSNPSVPPDAPTVLVIDDDWTARDLMRRFLEQQGLHMVGAASGAEGLRLAKELRPAIILLDVIMPEMDGWAVLAALKEAPQLASTPVIMATIVDEENRGYAMGATHYLTKPINRKHLAQIIEEYRSVKQPWHGCSALFT
jgi:signal transduction histidine kinase/CheY-like chemotaxis protein